MDWPLIFLKYNLCNNVFYMCKVMHRVQRFQSDVAISYQRTRCTLLPHALCRGTSQFQTFLYSLDKLQECTWLLETLMGCNTLTNYKGSAIVISLYKSKFINNFSSFLFNLSMHVSINRFFNKNQISVMICADGFIIKYFLILCYVVIRKI